jgi:hypothetical protein
MKNFLYTFSTICGYRYFRDHSKIFPFSKVHFINQASIKMVQKAFELRIFLLIHDQTKLLDFTDHLSSKYIVFITYPLLLQGIKKGLNATGYKQLSSKIDQFEDQFETMIENALMVYLFCQTFIAPNRVRWQISLYLACTVLLWHQAPNIGFEVLFAKHLLDFCVAYWISVFLDSETLDENSSIYKFIYSFFIFCWGTYIVEDNRSMCLGPSYYARFYYIRFSGLFTQSEQKEVLYFLYNARKIEDIDRRIHIKKQLAKLMEDFPKALSFFQTTSIDKTLLNQIRFYQCILFLEKDFQNKKEQINKLIKSFEAEKIEETLILLSKLSAEKQNFYQNVCIIYKEYGLESLFKNEETFKKFCGCCEVYELESLLEQSTIKNEYKDAVLKHIQSVGPSGFIPEEKEKKIVLFKNLAYLSILDDAILSCIKKAISFFDTDDGSMYWTIRTLRAQAQFNQWFESRKAANGQEMVLNNKRYEVPKQTIPQDEYVLINQYFESIESDKAFVQKNPINQPFVNYYTLAIALRSLVNFIQHAPPFIAQWPQCNNHNQSEFISGSQEVKLEIFNGVSDFFPPSFNLLFSPVSLNASLP